jgi:murein DD-endopeptidase MepM/ murein hydrolase activator NlpD
MTFQVRHLFAAALVGFVLGAFISASLGTMTRAGASRLAQVAPEVANPILTKSGGVDEPGSAVIETPSATSGRNGIIPSGAPESKELADRHLTIPVNGIPGEKLVRSYHDSRSGGREHEALDILAPRGTPVVAVEDGTVAKLFNSKAGGITLYQFDPDKNYAYYYAHLDRYADGVKEGDALHRGQVIGYVGTTGNAPKDTPHLHFAVFRLTADKHWWEGTPIDPYDILRNP